MKISELIELLEIAKDQMGDVEVQLAEQPSYPFRYSIRGVTTDEILEMALIVEGYQEDYGRERWFDEWEML